MNCVANRDVNCVVNRVVDQIKTAEPVNQIETVVKEPERLRTTVTAG